MATVINNREPSDRTIVQSDSSGWVFAILLLLLLIGGAAYWTMRHRDSTTIVQQSPQPASINVTLPAQSAQGGAAATQGK